MKRKFIPVAVPMLIGNEKSYVLDCINSTWISSRGKYIERFEKSFAQFCGTRHAVSCSNGTTALHLALMALKVKSGDEVLVPTLSYVATANAVVYCGAKPVFVDSEPETWNIDPSLIESKITRRTKGIIVVHLYGHPVNMGPIMAIARRHGLFILEDAAEAHGAEYKGKRVGSIGDAGTFSFYGNKIISTGEGGMVVSNDQAVARRVHLLKEQGKDFARRYWCPVIGYNYRLTNIAAAIGVAQLEKVRWHMQRRREVISYYQEELKESSDRISWQPEKKWAKHAYWMFSVVFTGNLSCSRDQLIKQLHADGIETRPIFYPMHMFPQYRSLGSKKGYPVAERIARRGISLPTWGGITKANVQYICRSLLKYLR
jgi:perosamine synthetase